MAGARSYKYVVTGTITTMPILGSGSGFDQAQWRTVELEKLVLGFLVRRAGPTYLWV